MSAFGRLELVAIVVAVDAVYLAGLGLILWLTRSWRIGPEHNGGSS